MKQALIGYGGFAREVMAAIGVDLPFFVDDQFVDNRPGIRPLSSFDPNEFEVIVAIADPKLREAIVNRLPKETKYFTFTHPSANIIQGPYDEKTTIGEGSIVCEECVVSCNVSIGKHAQLNRHAEFGHDCLIGDYFTAGTMVGIMGDSIIGDNVYFGSHSCSKQKLSICSNVIVGLGSVVVKNITEPGVYAGVPAKRIK